MDPSGMKNGMRYNIDERPGPLPMLLFGLQWWVLLLPNIAIMGLVVARLQLDGLAPQVWYLQKIFALMGTVTIIQVLLGHRLPLVVGPASTLLVGLIASTGASTGAMYTSMAVGGCLLAALAFSGLLSRLRSFFTIRIVAVILVLIPFTLSPTMLRLIGSGDRDPSQQACFALGMVLAMLVSNILLRGFFRSLTVVLGIAGGSFAFFILFGFPDLPRYDDAARLAASKLSFFVEHPEIHAGTLLSFLFCYLALAINELGSIESIGQMLGAGAMDKRITRGMGFQGIANIAAGGLGIIGPVDYSMSAGVISSTGCSSRLTLVPSGIALVVCAFFPQLIIVLTMIPEPVMGALMVFLMSSQMASGLSMLVKSDGLGSFENGITVCLPLMIGTLVAFAPPEFFAGFPPVLRPIVGNGFVMGTCSVILLEHVFFRSKV